MKKLAIVTSHPIQYNAPFFALLAQSPLLEMKVFYTWEQSKEGAKYDPSFKQTIKWDIPLLEGYHYSFVKNSSNDPGSHHFKGIDNPTLIKEVRDFSPDGLLVFGWSFKSHLKLLRFFSGKVPILFRGDSTLLDEAPGFTLKKMLRRLFLGWVYKHIDAALFTGAANKEYFIANGVSERSLIYAPHAIDNNRFANEANANELANNWRNSLGIGREEKVVVFAGKFEPKKNPIGLVRAFLEAAVPNSHLILAGSGVLEEALKEIVGTATNIHFIGFQNQQQMPVVYRLGEVYALPSNGPGETWGLALNEAMACGRKVLASTVCGGAQDLISSEAIGTIVPANNNSELKKALIRILSKPRTELLEEGKEAALHVKSFNFQRIADAVTQWMYNNA